MMWSITEIASPAGHDPVVSRFKTHKGYGIIRVDRDFVEVEVIGYSKTHKVYVGETPPEGYENLFGENPSLEDVEAVFPDYISVEAEYLTAWGEDWPSKMESEKVEFIDDGLTHAQYMGHKGTGRTRARALRNLADSLEQDGGSA
ncbi:hypothetical protein [Haloarcula sp. CGMCC 1.6347]|uniref:hypothetical protein n=1 Tax=Haloarcula sp. CGMCC 1.6347 TaxID=3111455 RepID=UPI00300E9B4E